MKLNLIQNLIKYLKNYQKYFFLEIFFFIYYLLFFLIKLQKMHKSNSLNSIILHKKFKNFIS